MNDSPKLFALYLVYNARTYTSCIYFHPEWNTIITPQGLLYSIRDPTFFSHDDILTFFIPILDIL